jgi:hypothetical protein
MNSTKAVAINTHAVSPESTLSPLILQLSESFKQESVVGVSHSSPECFRTVNRA